jgi:hypothetical protein
VPLNPLPYHALNMMMHAGSALVLMACAAFARCPRGLARGGTLGVAPGDRTIGRVDHRTEEHAIVPLLPLVDFVFSESRCQ